MTSHPGVDILARAAIFIDMETTKTTPAIESAQAELATARRTLATVLAAATPATARARAAQLRRIEGLEADRDARRADLERAVRAANQGQPEAAIQAAVRAL